MHPMHVRYQAALRPEGADYNRAITRAAPILLMMMGSVIFFTVSSCQPNTGVSTFSPGLQPGQNGSYDCHTNRQYTQRQIDRDDFTHLAQHVSCFLPALLGNVQVERHIAGEKQIAENHHHGYP